MTLSLRNRSKVSEECRCYLCPDEGLFAFYKSNRRAAWCLTKGSEQEQMDQLTYRYQGGTNRLAYVEDGVASDTYSSDLDNQQVNNYAYDGNGNMLQDLGNRIAFVVYDINNLPVTVYKTDNSQWQYSYDANGSRFRKHDGVVYTYYVNGADGKTEAITQPNLPTTTYNLWGIDNVGKVIRNGTSLTRYYYLKDHLGSVRMTVDASGVRQSWNDYYPFALLMDTRNGVIGDTDPRYKFTSKERDAETQYDYFGARYYDSRIGRWMSVDLMAEKSPSASPFSYVLNNPLALIDPFGLDTFRVNINDRSINRTEVKDSKSHTYLISSEGELINSYTLALNDRGLVQFPESGEGFGRYGPVDEGGDHYLNPETAAALFGLTTEMHQLFDYFRIDFGDMSNATGGAPPGHHQMHGGPNGYSGDCIDFRYLGTSMQSLWGKASSPQFSALNNFMFLGRAGAWGFNKNYASNLDVWNKPWALTPNAKPNRIHNDHGHLTYTR